jgi:exosortase D (VPLPA-CTERM-specific)
MSTLLNALPVRAWKIPVALWMVLAFVAAATVVAFYPGLAFMLQNWEEVEEYSYGYLIPVIVAFLLWQKTDSLRLLPWQGAWAGVALVLLSLLLRVAGDLSAIRVITQYGFVVALYGIALSLLGWRALRLVAVPLAVTLFMIPLPQFVLRELSQQLQLLSSQFGVSLIRLCQISVYLEGNVIDLGPYKLQVVEACSGLRYLFPLMALGFLAAYFFKGALWKRVVIFASTIPLTILINSLRIGIIGVTVEYWGVSMAEGFLHDFEGWFMFMICVALLVAEMALLAWLGPKGQHLRAVFGLEFPAHFPANAEVHQQDLARPLLAAGVVIAVFAAVLTLVPPQKEVSVQRTSYAVFPLELEGGWSGSSARLEPDVLAALALDDYLLVNYVQRDTHAVVNVYSAFYTSQSGGAATHSPRTCIPGGGWQMTDIEEVAVPVGSSGRQQMVNRAIIRKDEQRQLVYYWFKQRDRVLTNEYAVKWYIFKDGITRHRSDGALLRLVTPVLTTETVEQADARLASVLGAVAPRLADYVPD